jgi:hypothetical protein
MAKKKAPPVRVSVERCYIHVEGTDMRCPLCQTLVTSGMEHDCEKDGGIRTKRTRLKERP